MPFPTLCGRAVLAPMSGVSDVAFRALCRRYGAALTTTEFVSATGLVRERSFAKLTLDPAERPSSIQLFGGRLHDIIDAAKLVEQHADLIDFNLGCPVYKVLRQRAGSALLEDPKALYEFLRQIRAHLTKPFTVKIRKGIDDAHINAVEVATLCERAGAAAIAVHGRTRKQRYAGRADWHIIAAVKRAVSICVIGNGDVRTPEDAKRMLDETRCDYVMVGRGAIGRPYLFTQINQFLRHGTYEAESVGQRLDALGDYNELAQTYAIPFEQRRRQAIHFTTGLPNACTLRAGLATAADEAELDERLTLYAKGLNRSDPLTRP